MSIASTARSAFDAIQGFLGYIRASSQDVVKYETRRDGINFINQLLYDGKVYQTNYSGGALEQVLATYWGDGYADVNLYRIRPFFMPFKEIVETYQHVLPGTWGQGVSVAKTVDALEGGKPVDARILGPLAKIWADSNLNSEKAKTIRWCATFGTVGMRVNVRPGSDTRPARIAINSDHPTSIANFEEDAEGNVTAVCLKYSHMVNRNESINGLADPDWEAVDVVEILTRDEFSRKWNGKEQLDDASRTNTLGFCPYVIQRHKHNGTPYGDWAFKGAEELVHLINWRITRQNKSIDRHEFPKWFGAAGGAAPTTDVPMGDTSMTYVQTVAGTPPPTLEAIVAKIDQAASMGYWLELRNLLRAQQPELNLNDVKLLANTSGEALAQVLKPTEKVIADARPGYHHAFKRALQMGLSAGVQVGAWDLGTVADGDAAYRSGVEDFAFAPQPLLPATAQQLLIQAQASTAEAKAKLQNAQAGAAIGLPTEELWRIAGYTDADMPRLRENLRQQSVLPVEPGAPAFPADTNAA